jgi:hypothetical protein
MHDGRRALNILIIYHLNFAVTKTQYAEAIQNMVPQKFINLHAALQLNVLKSLQ